MLCLAFSMVLAVGAVATATASSAAPPTLTVSVTFDKASYLSGDEVSVRFSVHNTGTNAAIGLKAQQDNGATQLVLSNGFGAFDDGVTIAGGATKTVTVTGNLRDLAATTVGLAGYLYDTTGNSVADYAASAPVTLRTATATGVVYADVNGNGLADAGEGVSGLSVRLGYRYGSNSYAVTTGAAGRFSVVVPTAAYYADGSGNGAKIIEKAVDVRAGGSHLALRAVKPLGDVLTADLHFTQHIYIPGETVHIVVTLTNTGSATLDGIGAECNHDGDPAELNNVGPGWGVLAVKSAGVTLAPHQTRTVKVIDTVPAAAQREGAVVAACDFGYPTIDDGYRPTARDTAAVPGLSGAVAGHVQYFPHGHGGAAVGLAHAPGAVGRSPDLPGRDAHRDDRRSGVLPYQQCSRRPVVCALRLPADGLEGGPRQPDARPGPRQHHKPGVHRGRPRDGESPGGEELVPVIALNTVTEADIVGAVVRIVDDVAVGRSGCGRRGTAGEHRRVGHRAVPCRWRRGVGRTVAHLRGPPPPRTLTGPSRRRGGTVAEILQGRWTADIDGDFVVFIIGFRASPSWKMVKALPLLASMPKMLADLQTDPTKGMLGFQRTGQFGPIVQYWRSFEDLEQFARGPGDRHAQVWREWFRRALHLNPAVGIWHETYKVRATEYEAIYQGMPAGFGLLGAGTPRRIGGSVRAAERIGATESAVPAPTD